MGQTSSERSETIRARVEKARIRQHNRFKGLSGVFANSDMRVGDIQSFCILTEQARQLLEVSVRRMQLSARAYHRLLKLARTIADLADCDDIDIQHIAESIQYRGRQQTI
jgi:magnesium chelatase family protein